MTASKVFFTSLRTNPHSNLLDKMERLVRRAGIDTIDFDKRFAAIKIHFGEPGNVAYIRPNFAARMADILRSLGAKPFSAYRGFGSRFRRPIVPSGNGTPAFTTTLFFNFNSFSCVYFEAASLVAAMKKLGAFGL